MADPARRLATYEDVLAAPEHMVAEVVAGVLHTMSRPATPHANAASALGDELGPPFRRGRGGPGGWILLDEPEIHLAADIVVPDLAGWRRERMPTVPSAAYLTLAPDWICEVLSPSTSAFDRADKLPVYAREGVRHAWLVDPIARTLEVMRLEAQVWTLRGVFRDDALVRAEPFDAIELELGALWADVARLARTTTSPPPTAPSRSVHGTMARWRSQGRGGSRWSAGGTPAPSAQPRTQFWQIAALGGAVLIST